MKIHQTVCDVCGAVKKETNHWFRVHLSKNSIPHAMDYCFAVEHWRENGIGKDICGQECATKLFSLWLATDSIDSPALREAVTL